MLQASIILPTYNEAENIPIILPKIADTLNQANISAEIIVVDDNSPDLTAQIAENTDAPCLVRTIVRTTERGLATAVLEGFKNATGEVCVVMDADGSHPVESLPEMITPILDNSANACVGTRYTEGGAVENWPLSRLITSRFAGILATGVSELSDPTSGYLAIKRSLLDFNKYNPTGWKIVLEIVAKSDPVPLKEIPIIFRDRLHGYSKLGNDAIFNYIQHLRRLYKYKHPNLMEFIKFSIVGGSGIIVDLATVIFFKETFDTDTRICAILGFSFAVTTNYLLNRYWTFRDGRRTRIIRSYMTFLFVCLIGLSVRIAAIHGLITQFQMDSGNQYILTNLIGIALATAVNFVGSKFFAFSPVPFAFSRRRGPKS